MGKNKSQALVSIIIPVFNADKYLQECLDSIYQQSFSDWEIIAVNDGSSDTSGEILNQNACEHNLLVVNQANYGQGYARNQALKKVSGKYILFVDADDYIEPSLLEIAVTRAETDEAEVVNFRWQLLKDGRRLPAAPEPFAGKRELTGVSCEQFLRKTNYFAWDSLYRRDFIINHKIRFGEGYIYEDNEFIVQVASYANKIALENRALYVVRHDNVSSSRSTGKDERHYQDFLKAAKKSFTVLEPRSPHSSFYLAAYFLEKFIVYWQQRVPASARDSYLRRFVDILHAQKLEPPPGEINKFLRKCIKNRVFLDKKYGLFRAGIFYKTKLLPTHAKVRLGLRG